MGDFKFLALFEQVLDTGDNFTPTPTAKWTPKKPTLIRVKVI